MKNKQNIYGIYSHEHDFTTIMVETYNEKGDLISQEVVGWYYGKPDDEYNKMCYGQLKVDMT